EVLKKYHEMELFRDIFTRITASLDLKEVAQSIVEEAGNLIEATSGLIMLLDRDTCQLEILSEFGQNCYSKEHLMLGEGAIGRIVQKGRGEIVNNVLCDPRCVSSQSQIGSLICVPLKTKDQIIGAIALFGDTDITYSTEDLQLLTVLSLQAAVAIENALLHQKQLHESRREALIFKLTNQIHNSLDLDTILSTTVRELRNFLEVERCLFVWQRPALLCIETNCPIDLNVWPENQQNWEVVHEAKIPELTSSIGYYSSAEIGAFTKKLLNKGIIWMDEVKMSPDAAIQQSLEKLDFSAVMAFPIQTHFETIGILICGNSREAKTWSAQEVLLLQQVANQLAIALHQAALYNEAAIAAFVAQAKAEELQLTLQELQQTQTQLIQSEKMSSLGQLVAGVAHEINNPINFINGNLCHAKEYVNDLFNLLQLYQQHYHDPVAEIQTFMEQIELDFMAEDLPKLLSSMHLGVDRIRQLVLSLRNFSRLDEAQMKPVDIHEGIDSTLLILQNRMKAKGESPTIQVIKEYGKLPLVECYASQINQVFMNIIANAIDALEGFSRQELNSLHTIRIHTQVIDTKPRILETQQQAAAYLAEATTGNNSNSDHIVILISDNGPGMNEEVRSRLFDPFFTTKPVGKGTGLGLSISYQIVEKHGGILKCLSQPGQGAAFWIEIPIRNQLKIVAKG
ncbi:GAF domain-containing protein, partial [Planktothrix sp. FACHB-1355]|uniref:GAF domain-containing sensor histidine kinase n=1 Tax=Planktothrix sp. FACHB-1355 TaxID=2692854 RepID=UPI001A7EB95D